MPVNKFFLIIIKVINICCCDVNCSTVSSGMNNAMENVVEIFPNSSSYNLRG